MYLLMLHIGNPRNSLVRLFETMRQWAGGMHQRNLDYCLWLRMFRTGQVFQDCFGIVRYFCRRVQMCWARKADAVTAAAERIHTEGLFHLPGIIVDGNQVVRLYTFHNHVCNVNGFTDQKPCPGFRRWQEVSRILPRLARWPVDSAFTTGVVCLISTLPSYL